MRTILSALFALTLVATSQAPRNVRLRVTQEADTLSGVVRWTQALGGGSEIEGYEWRVVDGETTLVGDTVTASTRSADFVIPFPCGDTLNLRSRVRAVGAWESPAPWGTSAPQSFFQACANLPPGAPDVALEVVLPDTVPPVEPPDTTPPPVEPPDTTPPNGIQPFFATQFEAATLEANGTDGVSFSRNGAASYPNAPGRTTGRAVKLRYVAGGPSDDSFAELRFDLGRQLPEVWLEFYQWISGDSPIYPEGELPHRQFPYAHRDPGSSTLNKWFWLWDDGGYPGGPSGQIYFSLNARPEGTGPDSRFHLRWSADNDGDPSPHTLFPDSPQGVTADIGNWVRMRFHAKVATSATANDGFIRIWWDANLFFDKQGLDLFSPTNNFFQKGYVGGWHNSGYDQQMVFLIDEVKSYDTDPGW